MARRKKASRAIDPAVEPYLFELPPAVRSDPGIDLGSIPPRVWTENKAKLVARYLYYFELITKHGTYIDGFAGPQDGRRRNAWAAKLVLELEPLWLRHFYLYDKNAKQVAALEALKQSHSGTDINIAHGDFNILVDGLLSSGSIGESEATFALLDQRTFECEWATVAKLAAHKASHKIEIFYFLANSWLERAFSGLRNEETPELWWGRVDWRQVRDASRAQRADMFRRRFIDDLGYRSVVAWPIYSRESGGITMYYMIHATDHAAANKQMLRAYKDCIRRPPPAEQLTLLQPDD